MERKFNIMGDSRIGEFWNPALDNNVIGKSPCPKAVIGDYLNEGSESAPGRLLAVGCIMEDLIGECPLKGVY